MGQWRGACRVLVGEPEGNRHLEVLTLYGRTILKLFLKEENGAWTGLMWLRIGTSDGVSLDVGNFLTSYGTINVS